MGLLNWLLSSDDCHRGARVAETPEDDPREQSSDAMLLVDVDIGGREVESVYKLSHDDDEKLVFQTVSGRTLGFRLDAETKSDIRKIMTVETGDVDNEIAKVWLDEDSTHEDSVRHAVSVIRQDCRDMEDAGFNEEQCVKELADVCINARRAMLENGRNPNEEILSRLHHHEQRKEELNNDD